MGVLASLPARAADEQILGDVARRLRAHRAIEPVTGRLRECASGATSVMAAGSTVESIRDVRRSFLEAEQVADVAAQRSDQRLFYRLPDLRLRGLLHLLRGDARLQTFVERELGPLLDHDAQRGGDLVGSSRST